MNRIMRISIASYLLLSIGAFLRILEWGGYLKIHWIPDFQTFIILEIIGILITTLIMAITNGHQYLKENNQQH
jgi:hypothetical protein